MRKADKSHSAACALVQDLCANFPLDICLLGFQYPFQAAFQVFPAYPQQLGKDTIPQVGDAVRNSVDLHRFGFDAQLKLLLHKVLRLLTKAVFSERIWTKH